MDKTGKTRAAGRSGTGRIGMATLALVLLLVCGITAGCRQPSEEQQSEQEAPRNYEGLIVAMGDSLTAGLGVDQKQSYPALLEEELVASDHPYRVINAGISGETSSGALARVDWILRLKPDIVILETGANDGLRGISPELVERNIRQIIENLLAKEVVVVLVGMQMLPNLGPDYRQQFNALYPRLAGQYPVVSVPFFLEGVAAEQALNQEDGLHPNGQGYQVITAHLLPYVHEAIERVRRQR